VASRQVSDVDFLEFDAEVANRALKLRMAEQKLDSSQIASALVDQHRFRAPKCVGAELGRIEPDAGHLLPDKSGMLSGGQSERSIAATGE
jgi:hypothetical protein